MNNMRLPTRHAPTVEDALRAQRNTPVEKKKTPPPRPPPPDFNKLKSKSAWNLVQGDSSSSVSLIEWSPPSSPKANHHQIHHQHFNGSVSSSFSSSTSSLASSKKSYESESSHGGGGGIADWIQVASSTFYQKPVGYVSATTGVTNASRSTGPTIIRAAAKKVARSSTTTTREVSPLPALPMPSVPPPSPPKEIIPFGLALYDYNSGQSGDLQFCENDVIYLTKRINDEWLMGRTMDDREGILPQNFIDIQVPLPATNSNEEFYVKAKFDYGSQVAGDLSFNSGQTIQVVRVIDGNWFEGVLDGRRGQFPANFVRKIF